MFSNSEISAGAARLGSGAKLKPRDVRTLISLFRIYLKDRASEFSDLKTRIEAVADGNNDQPASELAALVNAFEEKGFSLAELKGGKSAVQTDKKGEFILKIQYGLTLLDYELPESFSGSLNPDTNGSTTGSFLFGTMSVKKDFSGW